MNLIVDRHFHRQKDQEDFNYFLNKFVFSSVEYEIKHVDSQKNPLVNTADMVAGAVLWKYRGKDKQFYNIIKANILAEKILNWPELKRKSIKKSA